MRNADASLVEAAARLVVQQAPLTQQSDLLSILGTFAEPLLQPRRFMHLVGREKLMSSGLFDLLMQEREAELHEMYEAKLREQEEQLRRQQEEEQLRRQQEQFRQELQQTLEETLLMRFPAAPLVLMRDIRRVHSLAELRHLIMAVQQVPDQAAAEQLLHAAAQPSENGA